MPLKIAKAIKVVILATAQSLEAITHESGSGTGLASVMPPNGVGQLQIVSSLLRENSN